MASNFTACFRHETGGSEDCSKMVKFWEKKQSPSDQEILTTFDHDSDLLKKAITGDKSWVYGYVIETKPQSSQRKRPRPKKASFKFVQMWRFCLLFSSIAMAWCIMNSCNKVVRSIRHTTLKLWTDCAKQFVRNTQNCRKTNYGFCTMITHQAHTLMLVREFLFKNKTVIMPQPPYSPDLASADFSLFPKLKTPMKGKRFLDD